MNTQQLMSFIQVAEKLSFSKAAEQLYLSVPTISRNIRLLEESLGVALLVRDRHRVELTDAGKSFYADAKLIVRAEEQAVLHVGQVASRAQLRIGCTSEEEKRLIAAALSSFRKSRPDAVPRIVCDNYARLLAMLKRQELDIMLGSDNMAIAEPEISFSKFCMLNSFAMVPLTDPLSKQDEISIADLENRTIIGLPERMIPFHSKNRIKDVLAVHRQHAVDIECDDEQSCIALASAGYGITILPEYKIPIAVSGCACLPVRENEPFAYGVLTPADKVMPLAADFAAILRKAAQKRMGPGAGK